VSGVPLGELQTFRRARIVGSYSDAETTLTLPSVGFWSSLHVQSIVVGTYSVARAGPSQTKTLTTP